jgi:hypothetical protein
MEEPINMLNSGREIKSQPPDLLRIDQFKKLPRLTRLAFAARCARWVEQYAKFRASGDDKTFKIVSESVGAIERYTETGGIQEGTVGVIKAIGKIASHQRQNEPTNEKDLPGALALLVTQWLVGHTLIAINGKDDWKDLEQCIGIINASFYNVLNPEQYSRVDRAIKSDFELLQSEASRQQWTDSTATPEHFFSLHTTFDLEQKTQNKSILEITPGIEERLIAYFTGHPEELRNIHPRRFEEIIAEIFSGFGFTVELTAQTRDGGRDIIAVKNDPVTLKFLIECKRFLPPNKVGIGVIQRLHGVTISEGASKGIIATTSYFSLPARQHLEKHPFILEGRDYDGIVEWLKLYNMFKMATILNPSSGESKSGM